jgi:hypothetical protein
MEKSLLTPETIPFVLSKLDELNRALQEIAANPVIPPPNVPTSTLFGPPQPQMSGPHRSSLDVPLIHYVFVPLQSLLRRNGFPTIPDRVLEKILRCVTILIDSWWWAMDKVAWEHLCVICAFTLGELEGPRAENGSSTADNGKGKKKVRDDETKEAAVQCLQTLLRSRSVEEEEGQLFTSSERQQFLSADKIPLIAQVLTSVLMNCASPHLSLQLGSLRLVQVLLADYFGTKYAPTVMPGVISTLTRVLPTREGKTHQRGEVVKAALAAMQEVIVLGIDDQLCVRDMALRREDTLEDLVDLAGPASTELPSDNKARPGEPVKRTPSWLRATASQVHVALSAAIPPIIRHPIPSALEGLVDLCQSLLLHTNRSLPQSQPLLLTALLVLDRHDLPTISKAAHAALLDALTSTQSHSSHSILQLILQLARDNLLSLTFTLTSPSSDRQKRSSEVITSICTLAPSVPVIGKNIAKVLGAGGGIEKWGWKFLSGLELRISPVSVLSPNSDVVGLLQGGGELDVGFMFPSLKCEEGGQESERLVGDVLRALGAGAGEDGLGAVEWFVEVARGQTQGGTRGSAALWCATRLLEGIASVRLPISGRTLPDSEETVLRRQSRKLEKHSRWLSKLVSSFWEVDEPMDAQQSQSPNNMNPDPALEVDEANNGLMVEHVKGINQIQSLLDMGRNAKPQNTRALADEQLSIYLSLGLQLLSISSQILESRFPPLLMYSLYPVLHSFVSPSAVLSSTALATLHYISSSTGYASPANLLLSNFDYALGSVSRHLTRRQFDMAAPKVLVVLVKLVGKGVVDRAADVVEECFERLEDYHGYRLVVEGLIEVLWEVVRVVEEDTTGDRDAEKSKNGRNDVTDPLDEFEHWFKHRFDQPEEPEKEDFGPVPRQAWGDLPKPNIMGEERGGKEEDALSDHNKPLTPTQALLHQIITRSVHFLTHASAPIRARVLSLLTHSIGTLSKAESALLPAIHTAWPFIINRLKDPEPYVVVEAAELVQKLAEHVGGFVITRVWEQVWPVFEGLLDKLALADSHSALARRGGRGVGTETAYATSHRLYAAMLRTLAQAVESLTVKDAVVWNVMLKCRRFLRVDAHEDLQALARKMYVSMRQKNADAVWLVLGGAGEQGPPYLIMEGISKNAEMIFEEAY